MDGIILLDKRSGISSQQAITEVKRKLKLNKIGHCGTLDPLATGLLICLTGRTTQLASYLEKSHKTYTGKIQFGIKTSTDDLEGEVISRSDRYPKSEDLKTIIQKEFTGQILQTPPAYSALKINGQRAYHLARTGQAVELKPRSVEIREFSYQMLEGNVIDYRITASVGTYIRSIARELGDRLGCGATIASLRREASLPFFIDQAVEIDAVNEQVIIPWEKAFPAAQFVEVDAALALELQNGRKSSLQSLVERVAPQSNYLIYQSNFQALGLLVKNANNWSFGFRA